MRVPNENIDGAHSICSAELGMENGMSSSAWSCTFVLLHATPSCCLKETKRLLGQRLERSRQVMPPTWPGFLQLALNSSRLRSIRQIGSSKKPRRGRAPKLELLLRAFCDDVVHKAFGYVLALTLPHFLAQADAQMDFVKDSMAMLFVCQMDLLFEGSKSFELVFSERDSATRGGSSGAWGGTSAPPRSQLVTAANQILAAPNDPQGHDSRARMFV